MMNLLKMILALDSSEARKQMLALGIDVDDLAKKLKSADKEAVKTIHQLTMAGRAQQQAARNTLKLVNGMMAGFSSGSSMKWISAFTNKFAAAALAAEVVGDVISNNALTAGEFELALHKLSSITGKTGEELEYFSDKAIELGRTTTLTSTQVAQAFTMVGLKSPTLLEASGALTSVTQDAITLALAAGIDVPLAAEALTNVMNQFDLSAIESTKVIDLLAAGSRFGAGDVEYLSTALVQCGSVCKALKVSVLEATAALETLANGGMQAGQSGRMMKNIILMLETKQKADNLKPSVVGLLEALNNLANANLSTSDMYKLFGRENLQGAQYLVNHVQNLNELVNELTNSSGIALEQSKTNTDTFQGSVVKLESAWEGMNLAINKSNFILKTVVDWATDAVNGITSMINKLNEFNRAKALGETGGTGKNRYSGVYGGLDTRQLEKYKETYNKLTLDSSRKNYVKNVNAELDRQIARDKAIAKQHIPEIQKKIKEVQKQLKGLEAIEAKGLIDTYNELIGEFMRKYQSKENIKSTFNQLVATKVTRQTDIDTGGSSTTGKKTSKSKKKPAKTVEQLYDEALTTYQNKLDDLTAEENAFKSTQGIDAKALADYIVTVTLERATAAKKAFDTIQNLDFDKLITKRSGVAEKMNELKTQGDQWTTQAGNMQKAIEKENDALKEQEEILAQLAQKLKEQRQYANYYGSSESDRNWNNTAASLNVKGTSLTDANLVSNIKSNSEDPEQAMSAMQTVKQALVSEINDVNARLYEISKIDFNTIMKSGSMKDKMGLQEQYEEAENLRKKLVELQQQYGFVNTEIDNTTEKSKKQLKQTKKLNQISDVVSNAGLAFSQLGDAFDSDALNIAGIIMQAIANVVAGYASASAQAGGQLGPWGWAAFSIAGLALIAAVIAQIHSLSGYANGGIVGGNTTIGDNVLARLNAGEMVLNGGQQQRLFNILDGQASLNQAQMAPTLNEVRIKGSDIYVALSNYSNLHKTKVKF